MGERLTTKQDTCRTFLDSFFNTNLSDYFWYLSDVGITLEVLILMNPYLNICICLLTIPQIKTKKYFKSKK